MKVTARLRKLFGEHRNKTGLAYSELNNFEANVGLMFIYLSLFQVYLFNNNSFTVTTNISKIV